MLSLEIFGRSGTGFRGLFLWSRLGGQLVGGGIEAAGKVGAIFGAGAVAVEVADFREGDSRPGEADARPLQTAAEGRVAVGMEYGGRRPIPAVHARGKING